MKPLDDWSTTAINLPEHADNIIHTDAGARAAGFPGALVAGVTTYAYLTHVPATAWGLDWLERGGATIRFKQPVLDGETVDCRVGDQRVADEAAGADQVGGVTVEACVSGDVRAVATFGRTREPIERRDGSELEPISFTLDDSWSDYGIRGGDDCELYSKHAIAHPTSWPRIANAFFHEQVVSGPWIHVRSGIAHHAVAPVGSRIRATACLVERFESRAGTRAILDVRIHADDQLVAVVDHEAIVELA